MVKQKVWLNKLKYFSVHNIIKDKWISEKCTSTIISS